MILPFCSRVIRGALLFGALVVSVGCGGAAAGNGAASPGPARADDGASEGVADVAPAGPPEEVDCGDFATCAIAKDGQLHCWGRDKVGELGDGAGSGGARVKRGLVPGVGKVRGLALASQFGCAILEDGSVKCWGTGRIANDGKLYSESKAVPVAGVADAEELVASGAIACARTPSGVTCWGADDKTIGTPPKGTFKQLATGFTHACALDDKGRVTCWGQGDWGGKGPFAKPSVAGALQVVVGDRHGCILAKNKTVQCWGMNDAGQLGIKPDMSAHKKPAPVPGVTGATKLIAGDASTCALLADGSVRCWGANGEGELGLGTRSSEEAPVRVGALEGIEQMCLASAHGCALTKEGTLLCWGSNASGQLGDGTKERRPAPTPVLW